MNRIKSVTIQTSAGKAVMLHRAKQNGGSKTVTHEYFSHYWDKIHLKIEELSSNIRDISFFP